MKFTQWLLIREVKKTVSVSPTKNTDMLFSAKDGNAIPVKKHWDKKKSFG